MKAITATATMPDTVRPEAAAMCGGPRRSEMLTTRGTAWARTTGDTHRGTLRGAAEASSGRCFLTFSRVTTTVSTAANGNTTCRSVGIIPALPGTLDIPERAIIQAQLIGADGSTTE